MRKLVSVCLCVLMVMAIYEKGISQSKQKKIKSEIAAEATIQRVVCFKFKPGTSAEAIREHLKGLAALKDSIPQILSYRAGVTIQGEQKDKPEYDVMHYFTFLNEEDIKLYYFHPAHVRFANKNSENWEKFFVTNARLNP